MKHRPLFLSGAFAVYLLSAALGVVNVGADQVVLSAKTTIEPVIDGYGDDQAWHDAQRITTQDPR